MRLQGSELTQLATRWSMVRLRESGVSSMSFHKPQQEAQQCHRFSGFALCPSLDPPSLSLNTLVIRCVLQQAACLRRHGTHSLLFSLAVQILTTPHRCGKHLLTPACLDYRVARSGTNAFFWVCRPCLECSSLTPSIPNC